MRQVAINARRRTNYSGIRVGARTIIKSSRLTLARRRSSFMEPPLMPRFHPLHLATFFILAATLPMVAQTGTVSGRVVGASGEPLQGASVTANGTARGATVRADGSY